MKKLLLMTLISINMLHAQEIQRVAVFCSSTDKLNPAYFQAARTVGTICAQNSITILFGGAHSGLMGALADATLAAGGYIKGILPEAGRVWNVEHTGVQEFVYTADLYERFKEFDAAEAFIILPGGLGTLSEAAHVIAQKQYGIHKKPIIFVNVNGFFDHLLQHFKYTVAENTMKEGHLKLFDVIACPDELLNVLAKSSDGFLEHAWWRE